MKPKKELKEESFVIPAEVQDDLTGDLTDEDMKNSIPADAETEARIDLAVADKVGDDELEVAKLLKGSAEHFELDDNLVDRLVRHGIAAKTEEGLMRGYKWDQFVK